MDHVTDINSVRHRAVVEHHEPAVVVDIESTPLNGSVWVRPVANGDANPTAESPKLCPVQRVHLVVGHGVDSGEEPITHGTHRGHMIDIARLGAQSGAAFGGPAHIDATAHHNGSSSSVIGDQRRQDARHLRVGVAMPTCNHHVVWPLQSAGWGTRDLGGSGHDGETGTPHRRMRGFRCRIDQHRYQQIHAGWRLPDTHPATTTRDLVVGHNRQSAALSGAEHRRQVVVGAPGAGTVHYTP